MKKIITINQAFNNARNSYEVINKIKLCREQEVEAVYISRFEYMTLKKFMFLVVSLSEIGYDLQEIKYLIKNRLYEELI